MSSRVSIRGRAALQALMLFGASLLSAGCEPDGKIARGSKTDACRAELTGALESFGRQHGAAYSVDARDADELFNTGVVKKSYERDGVELGFSFGLDASKNGDCSLKAFEKTQSEPGHSLSSTADYGSIHLKDCRCDDS